MKTFKKFIAILIFILCFIIIQGCQGPEELKIFIGEDGNWYINNTNSGMSSVGKDGVDGKSAYEIAVENGYNGSIEDWLTELQGKDGSLNVYDKDNNEHIDSEIEIVNNKILLTVTKTETITIETGTVNEIAYEELSFKNIFEDNNDAPINMSTYNSANDTYGDYSGKTTIQNEDYVTAPSAMYVTGTVSQQAKSSKSYSGTFYIASKVKCTRYEKGYLGIVFGSDASKYKNTTLQEQFDEEYLTCSSIETLDADSIFIGSAISANLDGYIDDPVVINMSIFRLSSKTN